jgi:hypothetical protein
MGSCDAEEASSDRPSLRAVMRWSAVESVVIFEGRRVVRGVRRVHAWQRGFESEDEHSQS